MFLCWSQDGFQVFSGNQHQQQGANNHDEHDATAFGPADLRPVKEQKAEGGQEKGAGDGTQPSHQAQHVAKLSIGLQQQRLVKICGDMPCQWPMDATLPIES